MSSLLSVFLTWVLKPLSMLLRNVKFWIFILFVILVFVAKSNLMLKSEHNKIVSDLKDNITTLNSQLENEKKITKEIMERDSKWQKRLEAFKSKRSDKASVDWAANRIPFDEYNRLRKLYED